MALELWLGIMAASLLLLVKSADYLTDSAEKIGLFLGAPQFIVGITIVAIGTSVPELVTSLFSVFRDSSEFVMGIVVGSNIANVLLILGVISIIKGRSIRIKRDIKKVDYTFFLSSALLLTFTAYDGTLDIIDGLLLIAGYLIYTKYFIDSHENDKEKTEVEFSWKPIIIFLLSVGGVYLGGKYTIDSVVQLTQIWGVPDTSIIAMSVVAIGTSLPELSVAIVAVKKRQNELLIGNILGSNIFNSFLVIGIPTLISPLKVSSSLLNMGIPFMLGASLLFIILTLDNKITIHEALFLLLFYTLYLLKLSGVA